MSLFNLGGINTSLSETVASGFDINYTKNVFQSIDMRETVTPTSVFDSGEQNYKMQKYNQLEHTIDLYLDNSGNFDKPKRYFINPAAVLGLHISDTVNDWVVDGSLTFMYLPEGPPAFNNAGQKQKTKTGLELAAEENGEILKSYQFRGDGFDLLRVMIIPKSDPGSNNEGIKIDKNDTKWMLSYVFSIFDVEDVNDVPQLQGQAASYMKCLKLKFHDVRYQMLKTTNLEYSTAIPKDSTLVPNFGSGLANEGVLYTGDALRDVFNEALSKPEKGGCKEFEVPSGPLWDKGAGQLFYTSPAQSSALDDVEYLYSHHVGTRTLEGLEGLDEMEVKDLCVLHTERASSFGLIEPLALTPLMDIFEKAGSEKNTPGELQKEHFFVTSSTEEENPSYFHRAPMGGNGKDIDFKTFKYGQIISYSFVDMSPTVNSNMFCTTPVYSVDIGKREFNIEFRGNDVASARKLIANSYISKLFKEGSDNEKLFLPTIHKNKKDLNVFPTFSLNGDNRIARQKNGIHNLIYTGLFQNACICFKTYGLTLRESGTFIGIDKTAGCEDNDYNNKLYGQWFVVKVDHIFEAGAYMNIIYAVKLHRHKELETKFDGTIDTFE